MKKIREKVSQFIHRNLDRRSIFRILMIILLVCGILYATIYGSISNVELLYTFGIILATAFTTKLIDSVIIEIRFQKEKIRGLRRRIRTLLFLWDNDFKSLESSVREISKYLLKDIINAENAFTKTVYDEMRELYALTNSIHIDPAITKNNHEDTKWETKSDYYKVENMKRMIDLCNNLKDVN